MNHTTARPWMIALAITALLTFTLQSFSQDNETRRDEPPTLSVTGTAKVMVPADQLRIAIGVTTEHAEAQEAVKQNAAQMTAVRRALERAGLSDDEIETGRFSLRPQYARRPRQPEEGWTPQITGYQVINTITIRTKKLEEAGAIIDAAAKAGSNTIDEISFELSDEQPHRAKAIAEATRNAISDATAMAGAAGVKLSRVRRLVLGRAGTQPTAMMARRGVMAAMEADASTPITPGVVTLQANVTVEYEIEGDDE